MEVGEKVELLLVTILFFSSLGFIYLVQRWQNFNPNQDDRP